MTATIAPAATPPKELGFDERLVLAVLAVDARNDSTPLDLADVIRLPSETPPMPAPSPYPTPIAQLLHRARARIETVGWCRDAAFDEHGAVCPIHAIRQEAATRGQADEACVLLLETIERDFGDHTIPAWNRRQPGAAPVLLQLDRAAQLADSRNL
ncbi:hypothetical protein [Streptomyces sp. JB150]|uniref:DUF6197 family protein n=1 Tax=Streptomyces sp. JB150 TaxID=2714844 RepID=UPI001409A2F0|nr:hypothetical protein [Streptomyces sp. JB150]QIJ61417.1 hypothetical protein G7Z13_04745 [Streptomyces sp. JB150]